MSSTQQPGSAGDEQIPPIPPAPPVNPYAAPANPYAAPPAPGYAAAPAGPSRFNVPGLVSLIVGGVAFLFGITIGWIPFVGFFFVFLALVGVVLGIVGFVVKDKARALAIAGTIVSGVALLLTAVISVVMLLFVTSVSNAVDDFGPDAPVITDPEGGTGEVDGGFGSIDDPGSPGDVITFTDIEGADEWQVVVGSSTLDGTADVMAADEFNLEPEAGNQYVIVPITVTYLGSDTGSAYLLLTEFVGADGMLYDSSYASYPNSIYDTPDLTPGASADIDLVFEVPSSAVTGGMLSVSSIWTDSIYIALD
ncbi:hypothetical protein [Protaetiibacter mangrovi]|uniref:DUF4352 domain-containing protein n=1 Tax=Protaetiibacter mangrovi TaxID=2970926 RepID=A0ABT1ZHX4_9MICO|nr:hypothetical protein [Protaetiibacter mangrovi]MCS0500314.1 hypothetical protein [Protaetiibacter mangrovi]TPX05088.1 hypothetical protein FJ656_08430 [Schumannella luteola]